MQGHTESLARLQAGIQKTQAQVSSGIKLQSAADDPVAAARIQESERWLLAAEQHERNGDMVGSRLGLQEGAIADAADILLRVRELAVQGGNGALDRSARRILATEVRSSVDQLMQIANRRSPSGEYLFAGGSSSVEPTPCPAPRCSSRSQPAMPVLLCAPAPPMPVLRCSAPGP